MSTQREIWIACGGTGGHFMPGVVLGRALEAKGHVVRYWGEGKKIEEDLCAAQKIQLLRPPLGSRGKRWLKLQGMMSALARHRKPDLVLLCGGFSSLALGSWAILHRVKIHLFEQNTVPGRVNRLLSFFASSAILTFPLCKTTLHCPQKLLGNPVRQPLARAAVAEWDILILGGSQGASALNQRLPKILDASFKVLHICGPGRLAEAREAWKGRESSVELRESDPNIPACLAKSRWVISRSGATSLSEMAAAGSAVICVPFPFAKDDHQRFNAEELEKIGAALILGENEFESKMKWLNDILRDESARSKCAKGILQSGLADVGGQKALLELKLN